MIRKFSAVTAAAIAAIFMSGCVSTGRYKALETQYSQASAKATALGQDVARLQTENATLTQEKASLSAEKDQLAKTSEENKSQYQDVVNGLKQEVEQGALTITQYKNMLTVDVAEQIFFASGSARLKAKGQAVLKKVGEALAKYPDKAIRVVGHTDNVPLAKTYQNIFPSNWELSVIRATNVVRFLQDQCNIAPDRLIAEGRGEYEPIAPNDTPQNRQKNRRIEITLIDKSAANGAVPKASPSAAPTTEATPSESAVESPSTDEPEAVPTDSPASDDVPAASGEGGEKE